MTDTASASEPSKTPNPVIADLPTGEPLPYAKPSSPSPFSSSKPIPLRLKSLLADLPSSTDAFLAHLQRCLSTPSGIDTVLLFICYTSHLGSATLSSLSKQLLLRRSPRDLALAISLPRKNTALIVSGSSKILSESSAAASLAALLSTRLMNLSDLCSETRTIMRLWSLLDLYFSAKRLTLSLFKTEKDAPSSSAPQKSPLATALAWTQLLNVLVFQALENGAYLASRGVLGWAPAKQAWAMQLSVRVLMLYTGIEIGKLVAKILAKREQAALHRAGSAGTTAQDDEEMVSLQRNLAINMAWAPLTLHWGTEKGLVNEAMIGVLGSIPGTLQIRKLWKDTAQ